MGFKGFPDTIAEAFPSTKIQLCVARQIRNSLKHICGFTFRMQRLDDRRIKR